MSVYKCVQKGKGEGMFVSRSVFRERDAETSDGLEYFGGKPESRTVTYGFKISGGEFGKERLSSNLRYVICPPDLSPEECKEFKRRKREEDWADSYFHPSRWEYLLFGISPGEVRVVTYDTWGMGYMTRMIIDWSEEEELSGFREEHRGEGWQRTLEQVDVVSLESKAFSLKVEEMKEVGALEDRFGTHRKIEPVLRWGHVQKKNVLDMLYRGRRYVRDDHAVYLDTLVLGRYVQAALASYMFTMGEIANMKMELELNRELGRKLRLEGIPVERVFASTERNEEGDFFLDPGSMLFVSSRAGETINVTTSVLGDGVFAHMLLEPGLGCYYHQVVSESLFEKLENFVARRVRSLRNVLNL